MEFGLSLSIVHYDIFHLYWFHFCSTDIPKFKTMNKEISSNNFQSGGHHEGQQGNIAQNRTDGTNNPPTVDDQQESRETREAESDRAQHKDSDVATRKGNSSI